MGSTRLVSRRRQDPGAKWARVTMAVLATVGVVWLVGRSARKALQEAGADAQDPEL